MSSRPAWLGVQWNRSQIARRLAASCHSAGGPTMSPVRVYAPPTSLNRSSSRTSPGGRQSSP